jgi:hypothetical protein
MCKAISVTGHYVGAQLVTRNARTFIVIDGAIHFMRGEVFESSPARMDSSLKEHANPSTCDLDRKWSVWEDGSISQWSVHLADSPQPRIRRL